MSYIEKNVSDVCVFACVFACISQCPTRANLLKQTSLEMPLMPWAEIFWKHIFKKNAQSLGINLLCINQIHVRLHPVAFLQWMDLFPLYSLLHIKSEHTSGYMDRINAAEMYIMINLLCKQNTFA